MSDESTGSTNRAIILDIIGLEREHLDRNLAPNIAELIGDPARSDLKLPFPAVTLPVQTTLATGRSPNEHGDIANGKYDRKHDEVVLWERERENRNRLWETASDAGLTTGVLCFQHLIGSNADIVLTPSPIEDEENNILVVSQSGLDFGSN